MAAASRAVGLVLLLLATAGAGVASTGDPLRREEAFRLYDAGRFADALPSLDSVIREAPGDIEALNKRGCVSIKMNLPDRALIDLTAATRIEPSRSSDQVYPSAFTNRGIALLMLGRDDEALADFQLSISARKSQSRLVRGESWRKGMASTHGGVGQVYRHKGDDGRALEAYNEAIRVYASDPNLFVGRGEALAALGRYEEGLADYTEAIRLDPTFARAYGSRALALSRQGRIDAALADYEATLRLDPANVDARRSRGGLLFRLGKVDEAVADLGEAVRLDPGNPGAHKDRGGALNQAGRYAEALNELDVAVALDPTSSKTFQNRAAAYNGLARFAEALRDGDEAVRLNPDNAGARNNRGLALIGLARYEQAVLDLSEAVRLAPDMAPAYLNRGGALAQLGRYDEAAADYGDAARLDPRLASAASNPSAIRELVRLRAAAPPQDLALKQGPSNSRISCDRGNVARAAGDWAGAIAAYTAALESNPTDVDAIALRGWARLCAGEPGADGDARAWFGVASWRDPFAPFMALLGALAARADNRTYAADAFVDEALANLRFDVWPSAAFRYLKGSVGPAELIAQAGDDPDKQMLARTVVGRDLVSRGQIEAARGHLARVRDAGPSRSIARDLARETLRRLDHPSVMR